jgi:predicted aldo/keto reductase-like oxidoreductase
MQISTPRNLHATALASKRKIGPWKLLFPTCHAGQMRHSTFVHVSRRGFLKGAAAGGVSLILPTSRMSAQPSAKRSAADIVSLGPRGVKTSRLMIGTGSAGWRGSSNQTRTLGVSGLSNLLRHGFEQGVISWDSADQYGSHPHLREALRSGVARDKICILTKSVAKNAADARKDLDRFRQELGTDYIDILLLHCLRDPNWPVTMRPVMDVIEEAQAAAIVRTKGVSCHSIGALRAAAEEPWVEVDLARINPTGAVMDADPPVVLEVLRKMKSAGKGVIGMKILGDGSLVSRMDECLKFALGFDCIDAFTIGFENQAQFDEVRAKIDRIG